MKEHPGGVYPTIACQADPSYVSSMDADPTNPDSFQEWTDLAQERLGGKILAVTDEFFAEAINLLKPGRGIFIADKYTDRGKWMDGWESRRRRDSGHDHCTIELGARGQIFGFDIDTNHFLGNHPPAASVEGCDGDPDQDGWQPLLDRVELKPGSQNLFPVGAEDRVGPWTHVRLNIYPDGGVARLRVYGCVIPDWKKIQGEAFDLASVMWGGRVLACNDMFFSSKDNLIMPGRGVNMGDGWETKRRRSPGHDWVVLRLGRRGKIRQIEVDTAHFKGNYPDRCSIDVCDLATEEESRALEDDSVWRPCLEPTKLEADRQHTFDLPGDVVASHVRLNIFPDGGVSRLRIRGSIA